MFAWHTGYLNSRTLVPIHFVFAALYFGIIPIRTLETKRKPTVVVSVRIGTPVTVRHPLVALNRVAIASAGYCLFRTDAGHCLKAAQHLAVCFQVNLEQVDL